jgi:hypothetical protein
MRFFNGSRTSRILTGLFAPPILGGLFWMSFVLYEAVMDGILNLDSPAEYARVLPWMFLWAFFFAGIQSLVYSLLMEFVARPKTKRRTDFILYSSLLGLLSGFVVFFLLREKAIPMIGFLVGLAVALLIYDDKNRDQLQTHTE